MSFIRILAPTVFACTIASHAFGAEPPVEIAQAFGGDPMALMEDEAQEAATNACKGKPLGAACSYISPFNNEQAKGKCVQPPPKEEGYSGMAAQPHMCHPE